MTNMPSFQLAQHQEEFLNSFLGRNDARTLLLAAPGSGKSVTSIVVAAQMLVAALQRSHENGEIDLADCSPEEGNGDF